MAETVEQYVADYQGGDVAAFSDIYDYTEPMREVTVRSLRKKLPSVIDDHELDALFDSALMIAVADFKQGEGCSFSTFFKMVIEKRKNNLLDAVNAKKRQCDYYHTSLDASVAEDDGDSATLLTTLLDENAIDAVDNLQCHAIFDALQDFRETSPKNAIYVDLIICESMYDTREEKHAAMREVLGSDFTASGIYKKLKKARAAFKEFFEDQQ